MFHYGAPVPGTGKTLLASSISIVLTGHEPRTMSYSPNEEESRKRYLAFLREGHPVGLIDNVNVTLAGDTLCLILTAPIFTDRVLRDSIIISAPTNTLLLSTGNNTIVSGDLTRRVLQIQLDPMCERPHERHYDDDFKAVSRAKRADILGAGLTILRAYECAGRPDVGLSALGSFEEWSRRVRNAIVWLGVIDPVESLAINSNEDETLPQLGELLESWLWCYGSQAVTAKEVVLDCDKGLLDDIKIRLAAAISEVAIINGNRLDGRVLGSYVAKHKGRIVNQLRFEAGGEKQRAKKWRVVRVD
jgi:putative DNA primase/helicase